MIKRYLVLTPVFTGLALAALLSSSPARAEQAVSVDYSLSAQAHSGAVQESQRLHPPLGSSVGSGLTPVGERYKTHLIPHTEPACGCLHQVPLSPVSPPARSLESRLESAPDRTSFSPGSARRFADFDADGDGFVTLEEFEAAAAQAHAAFLHSQQRVQPEVLDSEGPAACPHLLAATPAGAVRLPPLLILDPASVSTDFPLAFEHRSGRYHHHGVRSHERKHKNSPSSKASQRSKPKHH